MQDTTRMNQMARRCQPPGDRRRCRNSTDSFEVKRTKMYRICVAKPSYTLSDVFVPRM